MSVCFIIKSGAVCHDSQKRKRESSKSELIILCSSVNISCGDKTVNLCENRLDQFETTYTYQDVFNDLATEVDFKPLKTDTVSVVL